MHDDLGVLFHHARLQTVDPKSQREGLVTILKERGLVGEATDKLFFWRAEVSNTNLDSHFTRMATSTLRNYASDATEGVAFLRGHDRHSLPIGYSFNAELETVEGKERVVADFYTVAGLHDSDDLIARIQSGLLRDVSVGFFGGEMRCSLCDKDFWSCPHLPGFRYDDKEKGSQLATFTIENARLSEVSGVFDGSTPGAMILKAQERASELTPTQIRILESTYRVTLPATKRAFAGADTRAQTPREQSMTEEELNRLRGVLKVGGEDDVIEAADKLQKRIDELTPQAADGRAYRADLIATALAEGVRAYGNDFDKPTYEAMLTNAPLATIKRMSADWQKVADAALPAGRQTVDDDRTPEQTIKSKSFIPDAAFSA